MERKRPLAGLPSSLCQISRLGRVVCRRERNELGEYWLPLCVDRDRPREIIRIADEPDRVEQGRQLKMADLANADTRAALG